VSTQAQAVVARLKLHVERARARHGAFDVALATLGRYSTDDGSSYAAALTYFLFFSIFPLLVGALAVLGYVTFGNEELQRKRVNAGLQAAPMLKEALSPQGLDAIARRPGELALTGVILALYSGSGGVVALEHALNRVFHVTAEPSFVAKRLRSFTWLVVLGLAALASLALGGAAELAGALFSSLGGPGRNLAPALLYVTGAVVSTGIFAARSSSSPRTTSRGATSFRARSPRPLPSRC
jgi:uncharacterized BrkB/YihY/UPF0761 family membrane protein